MLQTGQGSRGVLLEIKYNGGKKNMSLPINPGMGPIRQTGNTGVPKKPKNAEVAAEATGLPTEIFETNERSGIQKQMLQGKIAKKLGASPKEVSVDSGFTFTGKALDKLRESAQDMAAKAGADQSGLPGWVTNRDIAQLYYIPYTNAAGVKGEVEGDPATSVSNPDPKVSPLAQMSYLIAKGPGTQ